MKPFYASLMFLCIFTVAGCSSTGSSVLGDQTRETIETKIEPGLTSKEAVYGMLGAPVDTTFTDSGLEVAKYEFTRLTPRARNFIPYNIFSQVADGKRKELVILFNDANVVEKFVLNESDIEERWGVLE